MDLATARFKNSNGIDVVKWEQDVVTYCPLGNDYCPHTVSVEIEEPVFHLDYLFIKEYFEKTLNGKVFSTEDLCGEAFDFVVKNYEPQHCKVTVTYSGYFKVSLIKEM